MADTTVTFATVDSQADVELVSDHSKPGWDDYLTSDHKIRKAGEIAKDKKKHGHRQNPSSTF